MKLACDETDIDTRNCLDPPDILNFQIILPSM